jgi:hypothetical protein
MVAFGPGISVIRPPSPETMYLAGRGAQLSYLASAKQKTNTIFQFNSEVTRLFKGVPVRQSNGCEWTRKL